MHDSNRQAHVNRRHVDAEFRYPTESTVLAAGWKPADFTHWPYG